MNDSDHELLERLPPIIRAHFDAVNEGHFDRAAATLHPEAVIEMHGTSYAPGFNRVAIATGSYLAEMRKVFDALQRDPGDRIWLRFHSVERLEPDRVLVIGGLGTASESGGGAGARFGWILTVRDDLIFKADMYEDVEAARAAAFGDVRPPTTS